MGAVAGVAGGAGDVEFEDGVGAVVGAGADGVGGTEEGDEGFAEGGGDVHGAGIVGDDEIGAFDEGDKLAEVGISTQIERAGDALAQGTLIGGACEDGGEVVALLELFGELREMLGGPAFGGPVGSGEEEGVGFVAGELGDTGAVGVVGWKDVLDGGGGAAQEIEEFAVSVDGVLFGIADGDAVGVKEWGAFAGAGEADTDGGAGLEGEEAGSKEALEIEDEVELPVALSTEELGEAAGGGEVSPPTAEAFAVEEDYFIELGMAVEDAGAGGGDEPGDAGVGPVVAQEIENGERVNHVADGAGFDEEDAARRGLDLEVHDRLQLYGLTEASETSEVRGCCTQCITRPASLKSMGADPTTPSCRRSCRGFGLSREHEVRAGRGSGGGGGWLRSGSFLLA